MIEKIEEVIVGLLREYSCSGLSEEQLFNYVVGSVGTTGRPVNLEDYKTARANLDERIVGREITVKVVYDKKKAVRLFLKE